MHVVNADGSGHAALPDGGVSRWVLSQPPAWSPNGEQIVFVATGALGCMGSCVGVYAMSAQGGAPTLLSGGEEDDEYPNWSPDGGSIAFLIYPGGDCPPDWCLGWPNIPGLQVMNADGTGRRQLISGAMGIPKWSADGRFLLVNTTDSTIGPGLVAVPVRGGAVQRVSSKIGALSPDGQWIAVSVPQ